MMMTLSVYQFEFVLLKTAWGLTLSVYQIEFVLLKTARGFPRAVMAKCSGRLEFGFAVIAFERKELLGGHAVALLPFHRCCLIVLLAACIVWRQDFQRYSRKLSRREHKIFRNILKERASEIPSPTSHIALKYQPTDDA